MANEIVQASRDWLSSPRTNALAWLIPKAAIVAALFIPSAARTGIWIIAPPGWVLRAFSIQDGVGGPTAATRGLIILR